MSIWVVLLSPALNKENLRFRQVITELAVTSDTTSPLLSEYTKLISHIHVLSDQYMARSLIIAPAFDNAQFYASFAGGFLGVVRSFDPNIHPPVPNIITPHWNTFSSGHTEMLFNKTEDTQVDIRPVKTDRALLQRCEYVSVDQSSWYMSINLMLPQILEKCCCFYPSINPKRSIATLNMLLSSFVFHKSYLIYYAK